MLRFHRIPFFLKYLFPEYTWSIPVKNNIIYLTFDDGPIPGLTEFVLDELVKYNAKATFFCVGENIEKHPQIFKNVLSKGHTIGNHTFNHLKGWQTSDEVYLENIKKFEKVYSLFQDKKSAALFRPPYGRIKKSQAQVLQAKYRIIMWDVLTCDYDKSLDEKKCLAGAIKSTKKGSIVVFHDSIKAEKNLRYVLPKYLEYFANKGFRFEAILR